MFRKIVLLLCIVQCLPTEYGNKGLLHRNKRFLVFPMGGTFKIVIGIGIPASLGLKQSMGIGLNLQFQYATISNISMVKTYPPIISRSTRDKRDVDVTSDRTLFYLGLESIMNRHGVNGRECLLRSICNNAMHSLHHYANGVYGELLHIMLTPLYSGATQDLDPDYADAQRAGEFGVDCLSLYPACRLGSGLMDIVSILDH